MDNEPSDAIVEVHQLLAAALKKWPDATGFKIAPPVMLWSPELGTKVTPWVLTRYMRDCDGDELGAYWTGSTLAELLQQITN